MPKIIPIGPATNHVGKSLWEIVGNLKNFGVGRYVKRNLFERYPEPTYYRILKIDTLSLPTDKNDLRKVRAYTERVFRGRKFEKVYEVYHSSWKPDFVLVPKSEEKALVEKAEAGSSNISVRKVPSTLSFPPLMKELIVQERIAKGLPVDEEPRMKTVIQSNEDLLYEVVKEGEKPSEVYIGGKGKPLSPQLYEIPEMFKIKPPSN